MLHQLERTTMIYVILYCRLATNQCWIAPEMYPEIYTDPETCKAAAVQIKQKDQDMYPSVQINVSCVGRPDIRWREVQ